MRSWAMLTVWARRPAKRKGTSCTRGVPPCPGAAPAGARDVVGVVRADDAHRSQRVLGHQAARDECEPRHARQPAREGGSPPQRAAPPWCLLRLRHRGPDAETRDEDGEAGRRRYVDCADPVSVRLLWASSPTSPPRPPIEGSGPHRSRPRFLAAPAREEWRHLATCPAGGGCFGDVRGRRRRRGGGGATRDEH